MKTKEGMCRQVQEDIITLIAGMHEDKNFRIFVADRDGSRGSVFEIDTDELTDGLCQIVVDNYEKLEANSNED